MKTQQHITRPVLSCLILSALIFSLAIFTVPASAENKRTPQVSSENISDYKAITEIIDIYIEGGRQGQSEIMKQAFHEGANIYANSHGQTVGGPIQLLYDLVDSKEAAGEIPYSISAIEIYQDIAMTKVDIENWAGAKYTDMFTLLKTDQGEWKIISKVSHQN